MKDILRTESRTGLSGSGGRGVEAWMRRSVEAWKRGSVEVISESDPDCAWAFAGVPDLSHRLGESPKIYPEVK